MQVNGGIEKRIQPAERIGRICLSHPAPTLCLEELTGFFPAHYMSLHPLPELCVSHREMVTVQLIFPSWQYFCMRITKERLTEPSIPTWWRRATKPCPQAGSTCWRRAG